MNLQPINTYKIRYRFADYPDEWETVYFCNNEVSNYEPTREAIAEYIGCDSDEISDYEIIDCWVNGFYGDELLSFDVCEIINGGNGGNTKKKLNKISKNLLSAFTKEEKLLRLAYIDVVYDQLHIASRNAYKENIIREIKENLKCYNYQIDREAVNFILSIFGESLGNGESVRNKLSHIIDKKEEGERRTALLKKLSYNEPTERDSESGKTPKPKQLALLRSNLDKVFIYYNLATESNKSRICGIAFRFMKSYEKNLNSSLRNNFSAVLKILCEYWGIDTPTYRVDATMKYVDDDIFQRIKANRTLATKIKRDTPYYICLKEVDRNIWEKFEQNIYT